MSRKSCRFTPRIDCHLLVFEVEQLLIPVCCEYFFLRCNSVTVNVYMTNLPMKERME